VRVIGYVRVSTQEQASRASASKPSAPHSAKRGSTARAGSSPSSPTRATPARTLNRPGLKDALQRIADGRADALAVVKLDRLTRNSSDLGALIEWFLHATPG
jgi:DNA invertase Pin-like site-specific DNA recombinase